jgi:hypothetical protein
MVTFRSGACGYILLPQHFSVRWTRSFVLSSFVLCVNCTDLCHNTCTVTANALAYFADQGTIADEYGLGWAYTAACQIIGSSLLLVGSLIYLYYSTATNGNACACISPC